MTNSLVRFNLTLAPTQTLTSGVYTVDRWCIDGTGQEIDQVKYLVTPSGYQITLEQTIVYIAGLLVFMILTLSCVWGFRNTRWHDEKDEEGVLVSVNDLKYLKIGYGYLAYLFFMVTAWFMQEITTGILYTNNISKFFEVIYFILGILLWPITAAGLFVAGATYLTGRKWKKLMDRGIFMNG